MGLKILGVIVLFLIAFAIWVRIAPLPAGRLTEKPGPYEPGTHPKMGGIKVVRPLSELPDDALTKLIAIAGATPRTTRLGEGQDPAAFVTKSKLWAFPDIAVIWVDGENLHVQSHLVFGRGDMGVNAARVADWFARLERAS